MYPLKSSMFHVNFHPKMTEIRGNNFRESWSWLNVKYYGGIEICVTKIFDKNIIDSEI